MAITIVVNGKRHEVTATPDTPLLYVLRNELRAERAAVWLRAGAMRRVYGAAWGGGGDHLYVASG